MMSLDKIIRHCESEAEEEQKIGERNEDTDRLQYASEYRQLAELLRELQRYRFKISECKAILDNPTLDVTDNDWKRAMYVLQTFPDVRGDER